MTLASYLNFVDMFEYTKENYDIERLMNECSLLDMYIESAKYAKSVHSYNEYASDEDKINLTFNEYVEGQVITENEEFKKAVAAKAAKVKELGGKVKDLAVRAWKALINALKKFIDWADNTFITNINNVANHLAKLGTIDNVKEESLEPLMKLDLGQFFSYSDSKEMKESAFDIEESVEDDEYMAEAGKPVNEVMELTKQIKQKMLHGLSKSYTKSMVRLYNKNLTDYMNNVLTCISNPKFKPKFDMNLKTVGKNAIYEVAELKKLHKDLVSQLTKMEKSDMKDIPADIKAKQKNVAEDIRVINGKVMFFNRMNKGMLALKPVGKKKEKTEEKKEEKK